MHNRGWLGVALASLASVACSDGAQPGDAARVLEAAPNPASLSAVKAPAAAPGGPSATASTAAGPTPEAVAVAMPPSTRCTVHPEGAPDDDAAHRATLTAGADGEIRFTVHPQAVGWGTRLVLDCSLDGTSQGSRLVDLNDASTFKAEGGADLEPQIIATRPALTGDLSSLARNDLIRKGYPPRPDPDRDPKKYATWLKGVTTPADIYNTVPVTVLGVTGGLGKYEGTWATSSTSAMDYTPWSGFVQCAGGFGPLSGFGNYPFALTKALYDEYVATLFVPWALGCNGTSGCADSAIWVGIGGWPVDFYAGRVSPDLLQSGFWTTIYGGGPLVQLFAEWVGGSGMEPPVTWTPPGTFNAGDEFAILGWAGDGNCNLQTPPSLGCFWYFDETNNWAQGQTVAPPSQSNWWPLTTEYVVEKPTPGMSEDFFVNKMTGESVDTTGVVHDDPGNASGNGDPYLISEQEDQASNTCVNLEWDNGSTTTAEDPMFFIWDSCGPH